jgi:hypothetical protein
VILQLLDRLFDVTQAEAGFFLGAGKNIFGIIHDGDARAFDVSCDGLPRASAEIWWCLWGSFPLDRIQKIVYWLLKDYGRGLTVSQNLRIAGAKERVTFSRPKKEFHSRH